MGSNREDDVERNHEDDDGEDPNGSGSDYDGKNSKENDDDADKNDDDAEGDKGGDGERDDDNHCTEGGDNYIPLDVTQASSHPENETDACLSKQASEPTTGVTPSGFHEQESFHPTSKVAAESTPSAGQDAIPPVYRDSRRGATQDNDVSVCQDMLTHHAISAEKKFQQTLSNHQSIKRSYLYLRDSTSSYTDTLQRFEKLLADHEELIHTNDLNEWEKEEYRKSFSSTSKKLERMTVKEKEAVEKCNGLEADLASTHTRNKTLQQQLQDVTECNKQLEVQLQNHTKDLEEKDREIDRLKEELKDAIIQAGYQEKQKQNIILDLVPSVVNRLLRSAEYKASIGNAFNLSYGAGYVEGVKVDRSDDDVKKVLARAKDLDLDSKEKFLKAYHELFTHQYPFVDKVSSAFRLPLVEVLAIQPDRPDEGSSSAP